MGTPITEPQDTGTMLDIRMQSLFSYPLVVTRYTLG